MKINRLLTAALITFATVLTGCVKESVWDRETGIDESKAAPEGFTYDEEESSKTSLAVYWDGKKAKAAGAQSFLVQMTDANNMDKGNTWDTKISKVVKITDDETADYESTVFSGFKQYDRYFVRIRANYPGSVYSPWVYINNSVTGQPALMLVGYGEMPLTPDVTLDPYVTDIIASWPPCYGATKYVVEWKDAATAAWQSAETTENSFTISGLVEEGTYDVKVTAVAAEQSYPAEKQTIKTYKNPFPIVINTAQEWVDLVNGMFLKLGNNNDSDTVTIMADLDFKDLEYNTDVTFKGVLNGNGKTFKNLKASSPLLKSVTTVKDLTIDSSCSFETSELSEFASVATIVTGELKNVKNNASVTASLGDVKNPYIIAGLAAYAYGNIIDCVNAGDVKFTAKTVNTGAIAGVVAYSQGQVNNTDNAGNVTAEIGKVGSKSKIGVEELGKSHESVGPSVGGIVGYAYGVDAYPAGRFSMTDCENTGNISYTVKDCTVSANYNRTQVGGIVGAPDGNVANCNNYGSVKVAIKNSDKNATYDAKQHTVDMGGIGGGDYHARYATSNSNSQYVTSYINCLNEGELVLDLDASGANSTLGGIVGWPSGELESSANRTENCVNKGNITLKGYSKCRVGGIHGGAGTIRNCTNEGNIYMQGCVAASVAGGLSGFHSRGLGITGSTVNCKVTAYVPVTGIGGMIGNIGNAATTTGEDCVINCVISGADPASAGMVVGLFNGTSQKINLGPLEVSGSINGSPASASNLWGTTNYTSGTHTINATIK